MSPGEQERSQEIGNKHRAVLVSKQNKEVDFGLQTCGGTRRKF